MYELPPANTLPRHSGSDAPGPGYMEAFGLNQDEFYTVCTKNPARVVGLELN